MAKGILIPLITPLNVQMEVCEESVKSLIQMTQKFAMGYVPCLTSGEGWLLSKQQWSDMVTFVLRHAVNKKVVAGIEKPSTQEVLTYVHLAKQLGATGIMVTAPFGENVTQQQTLAHFQAIHDATDLEIYLYNETALSNNKTDFDTLIEISKMKRVVGIKESSNEDGFDEIAPILKENGLVVFQGWENRLVSDAHADGNICSLSNLYPDLCLRAVQEPHEDLGKNIVDICDKYLLFEDEWYRYIKQHLYNQRVISSQKLVESQ